MEDYEGEVTRQRSPNFPAASLDAALAQARKVYERDRRAPTMRDVAARHMGYSGLNGAAKRAISTVLQYGLLEDAGSGKVRVSELSEAIIHPKNDREKAESIQVALHNPKLFAELFQNYGVDGLPSNETLTAFLVRDMRFGQTAAKDFLSSLRASIDFASGFVLGPQLPVPDDKADVVPANEPQTAVDKLPTGGRIESAGEQLGHVLRVPLSRRATAELRLEGSFSKVELSRLLGWMHSVAEPWATYIANTDSEDDECNDEGQ